MIPHRYRIHLILICFFLVIILLPQMSDPPDQHVTELAETAATAFLAQVDAGDYQQSWQDSSSVLKNTIPQADWEAKLQKLRTAAGAVVERQLEEINRTEAPAEDPDGEYLVVEYDVKFANTKPVSEILTLTLEPDGFWRIAGYHINQ